jgi:uncharacterized iron-regulated membrane protein
VRPDVVRIYKSVHTWTGILSGMALFIGFYAGAISLFKEPLVQWATPPASAATAAREVPLSEAQTLITRTLASHPEAAREFELHLSRTVVDGGLLAWRVHEEGSDEHDLLSARHFAATLEDDAVRAQQVHPTLLAEFIDVLHRVVGLPVDGDLSRSFMGVIASLYFLALVSGLVTLLPSLVKDFFALRVGPNLKRMWLDAHNVVGLGSFPFHVVIALTATVFAFHDPIYMAQDSLIHDGKLGAMFGRRGGPSAAAPRDPSLMLPPTELVARVTALAPGFEPTMLRYMRVTSASPTVFVFGHDPRGIEQRVLGGLAIVEPYSGRIVSTASLPGHQTGPEILLASLFALHFGSYGGTPLEWFYFVLGLLGAWLVYSGNLLWIESRTRKANKRVDDGALPPQRRATLLMASATVGVCLGAVCGISLTICCAKWLHGHVADLNLWHRMVYYGAFFAAVAWSFHRGAARASVDLLRFAAAATLAIPLTSLAAAAVPSSGLWVHHTAGSLGVDLTALALGLAFARLARATAHRIHNGRPDSPWSAHAHAPRPSTATPPATAERA